MSLRSKSQPLSASVSIRIATIALIASFAVSGCGRAPDMEFTPSESAQRLIPEVRSGMTVKDEEGRETRLHGLDEATRQHFGSLGDPTIWPLLPIEFGGEPAVVKSVAESSVEAAAAAEESDQTLETMAVVLTNPDGKTLKSLPAGSQVGWTAGTYEGKSHRVKAFDAKTGEATLVGTFAEGLPEEGDELLVQAGGRLSEGRSLYARHCLHCHGAGGAGNGPTAKYLAPPPRDFRLGKFKFTSTGSPEKASRADLRAILEHGIPGTSMPAFRLLSDEELNGIVEYVRWLAMRGEYEHQLAAIGLSGGFSLEEVAERVKAGEPREEIIDGEVKDFMEIDFAEMIELTGEDLSGSWSNAEDDSAVVSPTVPRTADTPESRARGRALYLSDKTKCAACHGVYGKGDGHQTESFQINPQTNQPYLVPGLHDDWGNLLQPRDLTQGVYRGGRRPIDVYRRIHAGIKGTPMPGFGGSLTEEEIWDVVNFVLNAPYETLPEPGKGEALTSAGH